MEFLVFMTIAAGGMSLISSFFYTSKGRMTQKTIAFQYIWLVLFVVLLSMTISLKYTSLIFTILTFTVVTIIVISLLYGLKYFAFRQVEKKGFAKATLQELIEKLLKNINR